MDNAKLAENVALRCRAEERLRQNNHVRDPVTLEIDSKPTLVNITERKQAEAQAKIAAEQERDRLALQRYNLLAKSSRDIILFIRLDDGGILEANNTAIEAYGYDKEELLSLTIDNLRASDDPESVATQLSKADTEGILFETIHRRKNGSTFAVEVSSRGETIDGTRMLLSEIRDITERKQAEEALRESEKKLSLALKSADMGAWQWDLREQKRYFDDQACYCLGLDPAHFGGTTEEFFAAVHPDDCDGIKAVLDQTIRSGAPYAAEYRVVWPDGSIRHISSRGRLARDAAENPKWVYGLVWDITKRKRMEKELQIKHDELEVRVVERTTELAATVVTLRDKIAERERAETRLNRLNRLYSVLSEIDKAIIRASDSDSLFQDFCNIAVEQGGFLLAWVGVVDEENGQLRKVAAYGATGYLDNIRITTSKEPAGSGPTGISIRKGTHYISNDFQNDPITCPWHEHGREHGIRASASVVVKEEGRVIGALTLYAGEKDFFDQSNVKLLVQMGADISFALDNLVRETRRQESEQALRDETQERLRIVEALREKDQLLIQQNRLAAMGEMINNIAHQWRQPLNSVALHVQSLGVFYDTEMFNKDFVDSTVEDIMDLINHMSITIDDFRNFFKPDKEKTNFNVNHPIRQSINLVEESFKSDHIKVVFQPVDEASIFGYPNEFSQVVLNILQNARDALLERKVSDGQVLISSSIENGKAVVTIADNAGGIPVNILNKIFEPYFSTKGLQGTGIGLHMSKNIIETNMGGRITVSNTDKGAEFRIEV